MKTTELPNEPIVEAIKSANPPVSHVDEDYQRLKAEARANVQHTPRQQGPYLVCVSCKHFHTLAYIGTKKELIGFETNGEPILKDRVYTKV